MPEGRQVLDDLAAPLDVVEDDAGEPRELAVHEDDRTLCGDLLEVLVGQTARGEDEAVDGG